MLRSCYRFHAGSVIFNGHGDSASSNFLNGDNSLPSCNVWHSMNVRVLISHMLFLLILTSSVMGTTLTPLGRCPALQNYKSNFWTLRCAKQKRNFLCSIQFKSIRTTKTERANRWPWIPMSFGLLDRYIQHLGSKDLRALNLADSVFMLSHISRNYLSWKHAIDFSVIAALRVVRSLGTAFFLSR